MPSFELILKTGCYVLLLFFGTHYIRTWAFRRYEAVTFECSAGAFLISVLLMLRNGFSWPLCALAAALLLAFLANAFCQWHFYMLLQDIIKEHFLDNAGVSDKEAADLKDKANNKKENKEALSFDQQRQHAISNTLYTMASVAIMPSYSRFIEESKLLNNPGGLIGLIKSILKRQRFQKKKYRMRDCFAENVNLIGPCKPRLDTMLRDATKVVAAPIHANDLALDYKEEKIGLVSLTFSALARSRPSGAFFRYTQAPPAPGLRSRSRCGRSCCWGSCSRLLLSAASCGIMPLPATRISGMSFRFLRWWQSPSVCLRI